MNKIFVDDVIEPEGPVWLDGGGMYLVEMGLSRLCITYVDARGRKRMSIPAPGRPNGLTIDAEGRLWLADRRKGVFPGRSTRPSAVASRRSRGKPGG